VLADLQRLLESLYHVEVGAEVGAFMIGRAELAELGAEGAAGNGAHEQLLVLEEEGETSLALFIADEVQERLREREPTLADFCLLAEGVSHFVYYLWKARRGEPVTQLELELQAEIDKYLACYVAHRDSGRGFPEHLREELFRRVRFRPDLARDEEDRYQTANRLALRYCDYLERSYLRTGELRRAVPELRRFYRLTHPGKIEHIAVREAA